MNILVCSRASRRCVCEAREEFSATSTDGRGSEPPTDDGYSTSVEDVCF